MCVFLAKQLFQKCPNLKLFDTLTNHQIKDQNENQIDRRPEYCRTLRLLHFFFSASSLVATSKHTVKIWASPPFWVASSLLPSSSSQHGRCQSSLSLDPSVYFILFFLHNVQITSPIEFSFLCIWVFIHICVSTQIQFKPMMLFDNWELGELFKFNDASFSEQSCLWSFMFFLCKLLVKYFVEFVLLSMPACWDISTYQQLAITTAKPS